MENIPHNYLNYTLSVVLGCMLAFLPVISSNFSDLDGVIPIFLTNLTCSAIFIYWLYCKGFKSAELKINIVDICFTLYICYGVLRITVSEVIFNPVILCEWFGLVTIYILVRLLEHKFLRVLYASRT